ncbi:accessory factor UbiK family protein [Bartonella sp. TP]|uniref:accessory factor UbiK family protein n=1 Tax=Bartonella sp. TP TaxID=3057550 RepID=UPI0025AFC6A3|nr:accessory factor UbiK family protein [Bartonella sp. TP]MDN5249548.1 accessory factor UbiK family protein [Alphaproteobacteria bacterium]WJW79725.1 accessory factor UbiK family protein [Bartonella sp. TP]
MNTNRILDNLSSLITDAASTAKGLGKEAQTVFSTQIEKAVSKLDLVKADEFEILRTMVTNLALENTAIKKRLAELEDLCEKLGSK